MAYLEAFAPSVDTRMGSFYDLEKPVAVAGSVQRIYDAGDGREISGLDHFGELNIVLTLSPRSIDIESGKSLHTITGRVDNWQSEIQRQHDQQNGPPPERKLHLPGVSVFFDMIQPGGYEDQIWLGLNVSVRQGRTIGRGVLAHLLPGESIKYVSPFMARRWMEQAWYGRDLARGVV